MIRIDSEALPDDVLLDIFDLYLIMKPSYGKKRAEVWLPLVHVCRRWRNLVFGSPRRLNLQLYCTPETPAKDTLDVWPALPLIIEGSIYSSSGTDNIITALGQSNHVCKIDLYLDDRELEEVLAPMQVPFPELTDLRLHLSSYHSYGKAPRAPPVIPDSFLGESAPPLRILQLHSVSFPGLLKLLLSATHLVELRLDSIPHSGYTSPQAIVAPLSVLSSLETLYLGFESPQSRPDLENSSLPPPKRSILPALARFLFKGVTEYLEELVARIDTPQLGEVLITFFNQIDFDCPRLAQFINRTPTLRALDEAHVQFDDTTSIVTLLSWTYGDIAIEISCRDPDWQLSSIEQVCNTSLPNSSTVEVLYIEHRIPVLIWKDEAIENTLWLELLLPFTAVTNLFLSKDFSPGIAEALRELVGGRITEVLPSLQNIFVGDLELLSGSFQENIAQFVAARQLSNHPIVISNWEREEDSGPVFDVT